MAANVGDGRTILSRGGQAVQISVDHKVGRRAGEDGEGGVECHRVLAVESLRALFRAACEMQRQSRLAGTASWEGGDEWML